MKRGLSNLLSLDEVLGRTPTLLAVDNELSAKSSTSSLAKDREYGRHRQHTRHNEVYNDIEWVCRTDTFDKCE